MSDRLKDLQRQRALAQEQLAWLDREIARETGGKVTTLPGVAVAAEVKPAAQPTAPSPDDIIAEYQKEARPVHSEVRRGCFLYFFSALGLMALFVLAFYFLRRP